MGQDIVSDALNQIMNSIRVEKNNLSISRYSKVLLKLLEIMKEKNHLDFNVDEKEKKVNISVIKLNECKTVKPRYNVATDEIDRYLKRFLPSRKFGNLIISTNKGLMTHKDAIKNKIGGSLIAYFY
jgi:ribosomal protein S8